MDNYLSEKGVANKGIERYIEILNACYPYFQWQHRKAQKDHLDMFGVEIKRGEYYFRMGLGLGFSNDIKLSTGSMDKFLYALFAPHPFWELDAENEIKRRFEKLREIMK